MLSPHIKLFKKIKRGLELVSLPHFSHSFWKKYFSYYILLTNQISLPVCLYFVRYWAICVLQMFVNQVVTSWSSPYPSNRAVFPTWPKSRDKNLNILSTKIAFNPQNEPLKGPPRLGLRWNKKHFLSFLKGFQLSKLVSELRVGL